MEIVADTISDAWEKSIIALLDNPLPLYFTQRGERAREILGLQMIVSRPISEPTISSKYYFGQLFIEDYCQNILKSSSGNHSINSRIIKQKQIDSKPNNQLQKVINLLKKESGTRRAIINLWNAEQDLSSQHPPCVCTIQFLIRDNLLDTIAYFRSNDSWMAALPDMIAISRLSEIVGKRVGVRVGKYHHFAASYHLYEPDIIPALNIFGR